MVKKVYVSYEDVKSAIELLWELYNSEAEVEQMKYVYGVPRGGIIPAIMFSNISGLKYIDILDKKIHTPQNTIVIDDIVDSGKTRKKYIDYFFSAIIDKIEAQDYKGKWIEFFWEKTEADDKDLVLRIAQRLGVDIKC